MYLNGKLSNELKNNVLDKHHGISHHHVYKAYFSIFLYFMHIGAFHLQKPKHSAKITAALQNLDPWSALELELAFSQQQQQKRRES